ncbi:hypothetical protein [Streptomyces solicathayae]|uniref:hypothetical protein n=1 Tax=Streptomyces solicathayae TaxID=3081768 RepID=UPI00398D495E
MNSHPPLLPEDRPEYERILDDVLRGAHERPDLTAVGERLTTEQLRTMALGSAILIASAAATEYRLYVQVRQEHRGLASPSAPSRSVSASGSAGFTGSGTRAADRQTSAGLGQRFGAAVLGAGQPGGRRIHDGVHPRRWAGVSFGRRLLAALLGLRVLPEVPRPAGIRTPRTSGQRVVDRARPGRRERPAPEETGAGAFAFAAVLVPVLAAAAAAIFLVVGHVLTTLNPTASFASTLVATGSWFAVVTAAVVPVAAVGLLITALRDSSTSPAAEEEVEDLQEDVSRARDAWRHALVERGILPFLRDALADPGAGPARHATYRSPNHIPTIGYSRPDFSGPDRDSAAGPRPPYSSPDFTSPDFGGSEPRSE